MRVLTFALVVLLFGTAHAEPPSGSVALLPLDADQQLEIYGQAVASEIARALVAGGIKVVVVGPRMAVPEGARLVVDGTIKAGKGDAVTLAVRVRDPRDGTVVDTLVVTAPSHTSIDQAAEELSGRVLPSVRGRLATAEPTHEVHVDGRAPCPAGSTAEGRCGSVDKPHSARPAEVARPMLVAVFAPPGELEPLRAAFDGSVSTWAQRHHHDAKVLAPTALVPDTASKHVIDEKADFALIFELLAYTVEAGPVPTARARVRVRIADPGHIVFDRTVVTDTVVGDRGQAAAQLAERVAREILAIVEPHLKRSVASWR